MVWAIDEWHSPLYYFPTDCPRVCFWPLPTTNDEDLKCFWPDPSLRMVIAIESGWLETLRQTHIYRYTFSSDSFIDADDHGVWVSPQEQEPKQVQALGSLPEELALASVELRLCPSLIAISRAIRQTSLHWSLIRMRFATGWEEAPGTPTMPKNFE